jgi:ribonuclease P/MRP protein subunit POP1
VKPLFSDIIQFELTGPRSQAVLYKVLDIVCEPAGQGAFLNSKAHSTWQDLKDLRSPSLLAPNTVLSLLVHDPRLR